MASLLIGLFVQPSGAQGCKNSVGSNETSLLKLRGQVTEIRLLREDPTTISFGMKLRLTFVNEGNEAVILLKQSFDVGAEMLARNCEEAKAGNYLYVSSHWPSVSGASEWARWRAHLDTKTPPANLVSILAPGNSMSLEVETAINVEKAGSFDRTSKSWDEIRKTPTVWLNVAVNTWHINLEPRHDPENPEFGEALRKRWRSYGRLQLERLTSEPMELALPSSQPSSP